MRNFVRAYNSVSREWAEDMRRQYEHECWACNMQLEELRKNNNVGAGGPTSRLSNQAKETPYSTAEGTATCPRDPITEPETIIIHGDLGLTPELIEANEELERRMDPYRKVEARE